MTQNNINLFEINAMIVDDKILSYHADREKDQRYIPQIFNADNFKLSLDQAHKDEELNSYFSIAFVNTGKVHLGYVGTSLLYMTQDAREASIAYLKEKWDEYECAKHNGGDDFDTAMNKFYASIKWNREQEHRKEADITALQEKIDEAQTWQVFTLIKKWHNTK